LLGLVADQVPAMVHGAYGIRARNRTPEQLSMPR
jgi:hypothetical protein